MVVFCILVFVRKTVHLRLIILHQWCPLIKDNCTSVREILVQNFYAKYLRQLSQLSPCKIFIFSCCVKINTAQNLNFF